MITKEELGRRIAKERQKAGLTQEHLATAIGLERSAIARIENGRQGVDTLQLSAIADALGLSPIVFFELSEEESLEVLLRAPEARQEDVHIHLEWLISFVRDYELLTRMIPEASTQ